MMRNRFTAGAVAVLALTLSLTGVAPARAATAPSSSARHLLALLPIRAETRPAPSARVAFGSWIDADHDGADSRAEVLADESSVSVTTTGAGAVRTGRWVSRYSGKHFTSAAHLVVDHLVPLQEAWASGARRWSAEKRTAFANDLGYGYSLMAVSAHDRRARGDRDPAQYLPPDESYRCAYVRDWIAVKYRWRLSIDRAEKTALRSALGNDCTSVRVLRPGRPSIAALAGTATTSTATATAGTAQTPVATPSAPASAPEPIATAVPVSTPAEPAAPDPSATAIAPIVVTTPDPTPSPTATSSAPTGATAICRDGTYSYSSNRSGTCSHHGGVSVWL